MKITDILSVESIETGVQAENKEELLNRIMDLAVKSGKILNREIAMKEVLERERIMSTGVGKGIALPHAKTNSVSDSVGALTILSNPIDFQSLDGEAVSIVFLLLGKENNVGNHLRLLSKISRLMNNDFFRKQLLESSTPEEALEIFNKMEEKE